MKKLIIAIAVLALMVACQKKAEDKVVTTTDTTTVVQDSLKQDSVPANYVPGSTDINDTAKVDK